MEFDVGKLGHAIDGQDMCSLPWAKLGDNDVDITRSGCPRSVPYGGLVPVSGSRDAYRRLREGGRSAAKGLQA